jgi:choline dehydrogenase
VTVTRDFDYIIVGAGTSGCVLAERLSSDPTTRVLLLEAGKDDSDIRVRLPLAARHLWVHPGFNWGYMSEPEPHADNRRIAVPRGKIVGGSSSINGMLYTRGHPSDFDQWRQMGCTGWSYDDVLAIYKRLETDWRGPGPYHGGSGPIHIVQGGVTTRALAKPLQEAARKAGFPSTEDHQGAEPEGYGIPDTNIANGKRASAASVFLKPARRRANFVLEIHAQTTKLIVEQGRAIGVDYLQNGQVKRAHAAREIILCGGVYNSPQLLMASGIGPADELAQHGIAVLHDLPGVGKNLQDHAGVGVDMTCTKPVAFERELRADRLTLSVLRWAMNGTGAAASMPVICNGFIRTRAELERPDIQTLFTASSPFARVWFPGLRKGIGHRFASRSVLLHPESRGHVELASSDPLAKPRIFFNLLATQTDRVTLRNSIRTTRAVFAEDPFASYCGIELAPGRDVQSDDDIDAYVRRTVTTAFHGVGTCKMGIDDLAVVDPRLCVRGLAGLRVADASIMPTITGGNTHAPALMIGEKASEMILEDAK